MASSSVQPPSDQSHLHANLKPIVWSLKIVDRVNKGGDKEQAGLYHACGFSVTSNGFIMTCASIFTGFTSNRMKILVRRLGQKTFKEATLKFTRQRWDLALLKVEIDHCEYRPFSKDGALRFGQPILCIGRSSHFVGSYRYGNVAAECTDTTKLPQLDSTMRCENYRFNPYNYNTPQTLSILGCFRNTSFFISEDPENTKAYKFERQLDPHIPVIQCDNFSTDNEGFSRIQESPGSPVFNLQGDIVGMLSCNYRNFDIAIHASALLRFKTDSLPEDDPNPTKDPAHEGSAAKKKKKTHKPLIQ